MQKYFYFFLIAIFALSFISCKETIVDPPPPQKGSIYLESTPSGAQIWVDGANTQKTTPDSVTNLIAGNRTVVLKLTGFSDTTFTVTIIANTKITKSITFPIKTQSFGLVRIYETTGTTAQQPSGLDLSTGFAYGISTADRDKVDIFYSSSGFVVTSAHIGSGMTRQTFFKIGTSTNLNDGVSSSIKDGTWGTSIPDTETRYVFLYDHDFNFLS